MRAFRRTLAVSLCFPLVLFADGNTFDRVRYNGGSVDSKVDPHDWHNTLVVSSDMITLALKDGSRVDIPPKSVTSLSYGQEAHRRVGSMVALAILVAPLALFGLFAKTRLHFIGIQYTTPDKKSAGILLQGDKDNYRAILVALQGVTGVPVSVAEKEREFVPVGVRTEVTKTEVPEPEHTSQAAPASSPESTKTAETTQFSARTSQTQPSLAPCAVAITSNPAGADILVDNDFAGNTPSTLNIPAGKHIVTVRKPGFQEWVRTMSLYGGSISLNAELVPGTDEPRPANPPAAPDTKKQPATTTVSIAPISKPIGWLGIHAQNSGDVAVVIENASSASGDCYITGRLDLARGALGHERQRQIAGTVNAHPQEGRYWADLQGTAVS